MSTDLLTGLITFETWGFMFGLIGILTVQTASRRIRLRGLLAAKHPVNRKKSARANARGSAANGPTEPAGKDTARLSGDISPTRVQLLLLTVAGAFAYLALLPNADPGSLPAVPQELLLLFGGSASIYVGGKGARLVLSQLLRPTPTVPPNTETDAQ